MGNLPQNCEETTQHFKQQIKQSIVVAFARTGTTPPTIEIVDSMVNDVFLEFPNLNEVQLKKALRNGGMGVYGRTFKLTTQELCIWIRTFLNEKIDRQPTTLDY